MCRAYILLRTITISIEAAAAARSSSPRGELRSIQRPTPRSPAPRTSPKSAPPPPSREPAKLRRSAPPVTAIHGRETGGARFHKSGAFHLELFIVPYIRNEWRGISGPEILMCHILTGKLDHDNVFPQPYTYNT